MAMFVAVVVVVVMVVAKKNVYLSFDAVTLKTDGSFLFDRFDLRGRHHSIFSNLDRVYVLYLVRTLE